MKPYQEKIECPKCGSQYITRKYIPCNDYPKNHCFYVPEHLFHSCECGFKWQTKTKDAESK